MPRSDARGESPLLQLAYYGYVVGSRVALALPEGLAYALVHAAASVAARTSRKRGIVARNLGRITGKPADSPHVQRLVVEAYRSYARYWLETFRCVRETPEFFRERFSCPTIGVLDGVAERGKGAIAVLSHLGNWDAGGAWAGSTGRQITAVAEVLRPRRLFDFFVSHRAKLNITIHAAERGVTARLVDAVEAGRYVAILGDRDLKGTGPVVKFFGEAATMPAGPASLAIRTGVPLVFTAIYSVRLPSGKWGWVAEMYDPIEVPANAGRDALREMTQRLAEDLETAVAKRPEEWHVFQPFWVADRRDRAASA